MIHVVNRLRRAAVPAVIGGLLLVGASPVLAGDNMMDQMVRRYCLKAVNDEVKASGKPALAGMATTTCKNQAAQQYNL